MNAVIGPRYKGSLFKNLLGIVVNEVMARSEVYNRDVVEVSSSSRFPCLLLFFTFCYQSNRA